MPIFVTMEIFYSNKITETTVELEESESVHCVRVLRHKVGDNIKVSGGDGNLYDCEIEEITSKTTRLRINSVVVPEYVRPYFLHIAVAPTKNIDRVEWFMEKATEMGIDRITPLLCKHSERKVFKKERGDKVILSAAKQSLKYDLPQLDELTPVSDFIKSSQSFDGNKYICFCDREAVGSDGTVYKRISLSEAISQKSIFLIGPEGDFSREEVLLAIDNGFRPVSLGESRLRTETAALLCVSATYFSFI